MYPVRESKHSITWDWRLYRTYRRYALQQRAIKLNFNVCFNQIENTRSLAILNISLYVWFFPDEDDFLKHSFYFYRFKLFLAISQISYHEIFIGQYF